MTTLNQLKNTLSTIATNHKQINSFGFGDIWEYAIGDYAHPILWSELKGASVDISNNETRVTMSLYFMDLVNKDERNETEVLSDQLLIAQDIVATLNSETYYDSFFIEANSNLENFTEKTDNEVSGWKMDLTFRLKYSANTCIIPD